MKKVTLTYTKDLTCPHCGGTIELEYKPYDEKDVDEETCDAECDCECGCLDEQEANALLDAINQTYKMLEKMKAAQGKDEPRRIRVRFL